MRLLACLIPVLAACSGPSTPAPQPISSNAEPAPPDVAAGPTCEEAVANVLRLIPEMPEDARREGIAECEMEPWSEELKRCAIDAQQPSDFERCYALDQQEDPEDRRLTEAEVNLNEIKRAAKSYFQGGATFPVGSAPLTPPAPCCDGPQGKCVPDASLWAAGIWDDLGFNLDDPHLYRYSYQSDGKSFVAIAVGDLDCDGVEVTYQLEGRIENGDVSFTLTKPARAD